MRWKDLASTDCPIARSLSLLGDRWTLLIIRDCFMGVRRFEAFHSRLGLSRTILQDRLQMLVDGGVLKRCPYQEHPVRYDYVLTEKGRALQGVLLMLATWGNSLDEAERRSAAAKAAHHVPDSRNGEKLAVDHRTSAQPGFQEHETPARISFTHKTCNHEFTPVLVCSQCGDPIDANQVRMRMSGSTGP
jgi:DNA-binding HxlR family transcriptional regulator